VHWGEAPLRVSAFDGATEDPSDFLDDDSPSTALGSCAVHGTGRSARLGGEIMKWSYILRNFLAHGL
jgi:hypothetical protein